MMANRSAMKGVATMPNSIAVTPRSSRRNRRRIAFAIGGPGRRTRRPCAELPNIVLPTADAPSALGDQALTAL
jgi:hypothetical protein